jgi:hypothetical protein
MTVLENAETVMNVSKWATAVEHLRNNRIEYLLLMGILHIVGLTNKAYDQVSGVCL